MKVVDGFFEIYFIHLWKRGCQSCLEHNKMKRIIIPLICAIFCSCGERKPIDPPTEPDTPEGVEVACISKSCLVFSWKAVEGAESYEYKLCKKSNEALVKTGYTTAECVTIDALAEGVKYIFNVRAIKDELTSEWSETVVGMPQEDAPDSGPGPDPGPGPEPEPEPDPTDFYAKFNMPAYEDANLDVLAFPGAEGGGMYTTGGRGGDVYHVTNLNDSGSGSLREGLKSGNRTIVFDVAGLIHLKSDLKIEKSNITIAGQTAPGDGICICDATTVVAADNIIIRFVRFRLGDKGKDGLGGGLSDGSDALWGRYHQDIILDHCSMSWSIDEVSSFYANKNFTMQWCNVSEAICRSTIHSKGAHGYGGLWGGRNASFHHNLLSSNYSRNARIDHPGIYSTYLDTHRGNMDMRNNVIYHWGDNHTYGGEDGHFNIVGNYFKPGPGSKDRKYFVDAYWRNTSMNAGSAYPVLYITGNRHTKYSDISADNIKGIYYHDQSSVGTNPEHVTVSAQFPIKYNDTKSCYTTTHTADGAFEKVLAYVGASLRRDAVDQRHCNDAKTGTVTITQSSNGSTDGFIDSQEDAGGWPAYSATAQELALVADTDRDGIPDWFEDEFGLNRNNALDGKSKTLDKYGRYTNLEMYFHYLVRDIVSAQVQDGTYGKLE